MISKLTIAGVVLAMSLFVSVASAEDNDSGPDWVGSELKDACLASHQVCLAACGREGGAYDATCHEGCYANLGDCIASIDSASRGRGQGQVAPRTGPVLDPGPRRPAKKPHPGAAATGGVLKAQ